MEMTNRDCMGTFTIPGRRRVETTSVSAATTSVTRQTGKQVRGYSAVWVRPPTHAVCAISLKWLFIGYLPSALDMKCTLHRIRHVPHVYATPAAAAAAAKTAAQVHSALTRYLLLPNASPPTRPPIARKQCNRRPVAKANWNSSTDGTKRSFESTFSLILFSSFSVFSFPNLYNRLSLLHPVPIEKWTRKSSSNVYH